MKEKTGESHQRDSRLRREIFGAYAKAKVCGELGEEYKEAALQNWRVVAELSPMLQAPEREDLAIYRETLTMLGRGE